MAALVEGRKLKITLVSAENLPDVRNFGEMKVYAVVSLNGTTKISGADMDGGTNPRWNFVAGYTVGEAAVQLAGVNILVKLWCKRSLGDRLVGEVKIGVKNLFESSHNKILRYHVVGTSQGVLNISCSFGPKLAVSSPRPHTDTGRRSSSSGKKVLKMMMKLGLSLVEMSCCSM